MKKIFILSFFALGMVFTTFAQEQALVSKKGTPYLPEQGEMALGIDATPFLSYLGNMFNDNTNNGGPTPTFIDGTTVFAKYFIKENRAIRGRFQYTSKLNTFKNYVRDDAAFFADPLSNEEVIDKMVDRSRTIELGVGYEFRKGKSRIQGFYGGEFGLSISTSSQKYEYGNPYSVLNPNATTHNFGSNILANGRTLDYKGATTFGLGLTGFLGVEYFILPKFSLGAEMAWGMYLNKSNQVNYKYETFNGNETNEMTKLVSPGNSSFNTFTNNARYGVFMMFHF